MKKGRKHIWIVLVCSFLMQGCVYYINVSTSEQDAKIFVNGKQSGSGSVTGIQLNSGNCVNIRVEKPGFFTEQVNYCHNKTSPRPPTSKYFEMKKDDSYESSIKSDMANNDIEIEVGKKYTETEGWKKIVQIILNYFDYLESNDQASYLRTSWVVKSFEQTTVRTRIILKQSSSEPIRYKLKIISEIANSSGTSVKDDEKFKEWDRILKKYDGLITECQTKLANK